MLGGIGNRVPIAIQKASSAWPIPNLIATAEEIAQQYPSLILADVYSVIGYYLQRRTEVEKYLRRRQKLAEEVKRQNEARFSPQDVRERLLARRTSEG